MRRGRGQRSRKGGEVDKGAELEEGKAEAHRRGPALKQSRVVLNPSSCCAQINLSTLIVLIPIGAVR